MCIGPMEPMHNYRSKVPDAHPLDFRLETKDHG
jgi:hypothetical protein